MSTTFQVSLFVNVTDATALHTHAMQIATAQDTQLTVDDAVSQLGTAEEPDITACLKMVLDPGQSPPGTSILDATCE